MTTPCAALPRLELGYVPIRPHVVVRIEEYWRSGFAEAILVSTQP